MSPNKRMTIILIIAAVLLVAVCAAVWHYLFGKPNPQLPMAQVSINASGTGTGVGASATTTPSAIATTTASSTDVDIANPTLPEEKLSIDNATWTVEMATTAVEQTRGLSYRSSLAPDSGMLFVFGGPSIQNFWMKDMNFPLDMIWIASDGTVAGFAQNVPAPASGTALWDLPVYTSPSGVSEVLEVNAGTVAKYNIKVGDVVIVSPL